ncbi:MAG: hypothetical protein HY348_03090 [Nitrospira defluvii]|nr:hypothetical protein [Nitrospira defluvii]
MEHPTGVSRWRSLQVFMLAYLLMVGTALPLSAEELQPDVNAADTIKQTLDQQV